MQRVFRERSVLSSNALTPGPACLSDHLLFSTHFNSGRKKVVSVRGVSVEFLCQERKSQMRAQLRVKNFDKGEEVQAWWSSLKQEPCEPLVQTTAKREEGGHSVNYERPTQRNIQGLAKSDELLHKPEALLAQVAVSADPSVPNIIVAQMTSPGPLVLDGTGDLGNSKQQSFVRTEGWSTG